MAVWPSIVSPSARPSPPWKSSPGFTTSASSNKFGDGRLNYQIAATQACQPPDRDRYLTSHDDLVSWAADPVQFDCQCERENPSDPTVDPSACAAESVRFQH